MATKALRRGAFFDGREFGNCCWLGGSAGCRGVLAVGAEMIFDEGMRVVGCGLMMVVSWSYRASSSTWVVGMKSLIREEEVMLEGLSAGEHAMVFIVHSLLSFYEIPY